MKLTSRRRKRILRISQRSVFLLQLRLVAVVPVLLRLLVAERADVVDKARALLLLAAAPAVAVARAQFLQFPVLLQRPAVEVAVLLQLRLPWP